MGLLVTEVTEAQSFELDSSAGGMCVPCDSPDWFFVSKDNSHSPLGTRVTSQSPFMPSALSKNGLAGQCLLRHELVSCF